MKFNKKIEDLQIALKDFSKNDLLVVFIPPEFWSQETLDELREVAGSLKIENSVRNMLFLPSFYDVKKINFIGIEGKEIDKVDIKDDVINIEFVDKMSKDSKNKAPSS